MREATASKVSTDCRCKRNGQSEEEGSETTLFSDGGALTITSADPARLAPLKQTGLEMGWSC